MYVCKPEHTSRADCSVIIIIIINEALWLSRIEIWGARFTSIFSVFSLIAGWILEMLFMLFFAYVAVKQTKHS